MEVFKVSSLADKVFEKLEKDIMTGVFQPDEILTEMKLVQMLGVSRTPIREALRRLNQEGLVADMGKGSRVLGVTKEELADILFIRQQAEPIAAFYAAQNGTEEMKMELSDILDLQEHYLRKRDTQQLVWLDNKFHSVIYKMSQRTVVEHLLLRFMRQTYRFRYEQMENRETGEKVIQEHREILIAICSDNGDAAKEMAYKHLQREAQSSTK